MSVSPGPFHSLRLEGKLEGWCVGFEAWLPTGPPVGDRLAMGPSRLHSKQPPGKEGDVLQALP